MAVMAGILVSSFWPHIPVALGSSAPPGALWYTVVAGDDIQKIATKLGLADKMWVVYWNNIPSPYYVYLNEALKYIPSGSSGASRPSGTLVPTTGVLLGAYDDSGISHFEGQLGRSVVINQHFYSGLQTVGVDLSNIMSNDFATGHIPLITWDMPGTTPLLTSIISGSYDTGLKAYANVFKQQGKHVFLRWGSEMNGNWIPAIDGSHNGGPSTGPSNFISAYRHIHDLFVAQGATNVIWVWTPNAGSVPRDSWINWKNYYPGDAYVDWVGIDGYNRDPSPWVTTSSIFQSVYNDYKATKPIMIAETGTIEAGDSGNLKSAWFVDAATSMQNSMPSIAAYVYFNSNTSTHAWRIDTTSTSLTGFKTAFAHDAYYSVTVSP